MTGNDGRHNIGNTGHIEATRPTRFARLSSPYPPTGHASVHATATAGFSRSKGPQNMGQVNQVNREEKWQVVMRGGSSSTQP